MVNVTQYAILVIVALLSPAYLCWALGRKLDALGRKLDTAEETIKQSLCRLESGLESWRPPK
jgi:hypothetical protein